MAAQIGVSPAEVKQREGVIRTGRQVQVQQAQVAFELLVAQGGIDVAGVGDGDVGEADGIAGAAEGGQDLLVDAVVPAEAGTVTEEADLIDDGGGSGVTGERRLLHDEGGVVVVEAAQQVEELATVGLVEVLVGVQPQDPVAGGMAERLRCVRRRSRRTKGSPRHGRRSCGDLLVRSEEPVSTTTISSTMPRTDCRQAAAWRPRS